MKCHIGCTGWSYDGWKGPFYPPNLENQYWLAYYSQIFSFVEIDSTFYRVPSKFMVSNWNKRTPNDFRFTVKFPKAITHDSTKVKNSDSKIFLGDLDEKVSEFIDVLKPLQKKILAFLIQLPPWLKIKEGLEFLKSLEYSLDTSFRYAVEVRHPSWYNDLAYHYLKKMNYCLVWSQMDRLITPPVITSDFVYLRLIGDRSIADKDFGKVVKDRKQEIQNWSNIVKDLTGYDKDDSSNSEIKMVIVAANNHYAGFGPDSTKLFAQTFDRKIMIPSFPISDYQPFSAINSIDSNNADIGGSEDEDSRDHYQYKKKNVKKQRQSFISDFLK